MSAVFFKFRLLPVLAVFLLSGCFGSFSHLNGLGKDTSLFAQRPVRAMANEVGVGIPGAGVLAILPLRAEETGIPEDILEGIEETFAEQLQAGKPGLRIKTRGDLGKIRDEAGPMSRERLEDELRSKEVAYLVVPTALPYPDGIEMSFRAFDIREGAGGRPIGASLSRNVRIESPQSLALSPAAAAAVAARGLSAKVLMSRSGSGTRQFTLRPEGGTLPFIDYLAGLVNGHLEDLRPASDAGETGVLELTLRTEVRDDGDMASVVFDVLDGGGQKIGRQSVVLDTKLIAENHKPLTPRVPTVEETVFSATGRARIGPALNERQALAAARMMARGDVVQQALGVRRTFRDPAQTLGAALWAMGVLGPFLPFEEDWSRAQTDDPNLVRVDLKARVHRFDPSPAEGLRASLTPEKVRPGEPIGVELSAQRDGFAGVFLWQADGTLSRAFPSGDRPHIEIKAGQTLILPGEDEAPVVSRPVAGATQELGALVVVVSVAPVDFRELGGDAADSRFLDYLAEQDPETVSVFVLPYISRASESAGADVKP